MYFKIGVLESFAIFSGKHLCWGLFLVKLQWLLLRCKSMIKIFTIARNLFASIKVAPLPSSRCPLASLVDTFLFGKKVVTRKHDCTQIIICIHKYNLFLAKKTSPGNMIEIKSFLHMEKQNTRSLSTSQHLRNKIFAAHLTITSFN